MYDIKNPYDGSKEAAKFIKENKLDKYPILEVGSLSAGINAYFEKNISSNRKKAYEEWKGMPSRQFITDTKKLTPVIVMAANGNRYLLNKITEPYLEKNYDKYIFEGNFYTTNYDKQLYQFHENNHTEITLFVRKDIKIGE